MDINPKLYIAPTNERGLGLFAKQLIKKGKLIFSFSGIEFRVSDSQEIYAVSTDIK